MQHDASGDVRFEYDSPTLRLGRGSVADLGEELAAAGCERALVVCGSTVGQTDAVMEPVRAGLGDRLAGEFARTTPDKRLSNAYDGVAAMKRHDADALVAVGGGSSIDVAKVMSILREDDRAPDRVGAELAETGTISIPVGGLTPIFAVPTTLAGADLSQVAGITAHPSSSLVEEFVAGGVGDARLMPTAVVGDAELVATTPASVLAGSAMNGFDKGLETLYASTRTPVTDGTASHGLRLLAEHLPRLRSEGATPGVLEPVVEGITLVQYGISRPSETTLSVVHAFGHGLTRGYGVQQGVAHAVVVPHVLRYLFEHVDGRRELLAEALGVGDAAEPATAVVDAVTAVRDALDLPTRLRDVDGPEPEEFPAVAEAILGDSFMRNAPPGLDATREEVEAVVEAAY
ncbi:iron-containing alcohol dehydrogenase family protein [Haloarchaeobius litoreus]|uniref:Iron-containing alcohol dehydrogenase family protein n=1 Tax=Haloarchaeobius litoreus TaxID=755306 RepID=A0ABD6DHM8_9EURY|nr:iron-containing alcohol dehydrogenase family protein [Haloarchaeobius litoreus]